MGEGVILCAKYYSGVKAGNILVKVVSDTFGLQIQIKKK